MGLTKTGGSDLGSVRPSAVGGLLQVPGFSSERHDLVFAQLAPIALLPNYRHIGIPRFFPP
jgi:hypothetical protein